MKGVLHCVTIVPTPKSLVDYWKKTYGGKDEDYAYQVVEGEPMTTSFGTYGMDKDDLETYLTAYTPLVDSWVHAG